MIPKKNMSKEEMLKELKDIAELLDKTPSRAEFIEYSKTKYGFHKYWEYYRDFTEEAGLESHNSGRRTIKNKTDPAVSHAQALRLFKDYMKTHNEERLTETQFAKMFPAIRSVIKIFYNGKYNNFVLAAGGKPTRIHHAGRGKMPYTYEELISLMRQDFVENDIPQNKYLFTKKHHMHYSWVDKLFGSYENLLNQAREPKKTYNPAWQKRYSVRYLPTPVILKWARRRSPKAKI